MRVDRTVASREAATRSSSGYGAAVTAATSRSGARAAETAARKQRLIAAATELAAEGGYDAVQMRDVAGRADVALGTLYRHYASRDQLLLAALAAQAAGLRERLDQRPPRGDVPADRVADVLRRATRALERQPRVTHAMVTAMSVSDDSAAPVKQEITQTLRAIIVDAVDGTPVPDLDDVVRVLGSVWFAELTFWSGGLTDASAMADHLARAAALVLGPR
jgi:TetR/AcrR family transcriptional regulator, cholesterol catabolism regulator